MVKEFEYPKSTSFGAYSPPLLVTEGRNLNNFTVYHSIPNNPLSQSEVEIESGLTFLVLTFSTSH